ncbi:MAG: hypothetical protein Kow0092_06140 [Deferrisomatales bacterium]
MAATWDDAFYALGWLHGRDRGGQVCVLRLTAQGRLSEVFGGEPGLLELDLYLRRFAFAREAADHAAGIAAEVAPWVAAYCRGLTEALAGRRPGPLRLVGYRPEPFRPADVLALAKLFSFVGLAEMQRAGELVVVEAARRRVDPDRLRELFPGLGPIDPELLGRLQGVPTIFAPGGSAEAPAPGWGSNAWAVAGSHTRSGAPLLCNDPHLEIHRLPPVGYEAWLEVGSRWVKGLTVAGLPGFLLGRTPELAWGVTYSCADTSDFFVERCRGGAHRRGARWVAFRPRRERIECRKGPAREVTFYDNDRGTLEGDPEGEGLVLCWAWAGRGDAGTGALQGFTALLFSRSVAEAQRAVEAVDLPTLHFVFADRSGGIGYRFAGRVPLRRPGWNGLEPAPGWDPENDWRGWVGPEGQPSESNPAGGFVVSANEARQCPGGPVLVTLPLAPFRRERIGELLSSRAPLTAADMQQFQYDLVSLEARTLLPLYLPHLPPGPHRRLLERWDGRYGADSVAAAVFESIHREVLVEVFGGGGLGRQWLRHLLEETGLYYALAGPFARVLAAASSRWLPAEARVERLARGVRAGLAAPPVPWGRRQAVTFENLFFAGRLPRVLGFDRGPYPLPGSHATVRAGVLGRAWGQVRAVGPACHFVTDLAQEAVHTNLPGGPKESRLSPWYANDLKRWLAGAYKTY